MANEFMQPTSVIDIIDDQQKNSVKNLPIRIAMDGKWYLGSSVFNKSSIVKLLSSRLLRDGVRYCLKEDQWRLPIIVEDLPLQAVSLNRASDGGLVLSTGEGDTFCLGSDHRFALSYRKPNEAPLPMVYVRDNLWARISRSVYYQLIEEAFEGALNMHPYFHTNSNDCILEKLAVLSMKTGDEIKQVQPLVAVNSHEVDRYGSGLWLNSKHYFVDLLADAAAQAI